MRWYGLFKQTISLQFFFFKVFFYKFNLAHSSILCPKHASGQKLSRRYTTLSETVSNADFLNHISSNANFIDFQIFNSAILRILTSSRTVHFRKLYHNKNQIKFYFDTLWCLKWPSKTFWGTPKTCENKNLSYFSLFILDRDKLLLLLLIYLTLAMIKYTVSVNC